MGRWKLHTEHQHSSSIDDDIFALSQTLKSHSIDRSFSEHQLLHFHACIDPIPGVGSSVKDESTVPAWITNRFDGAFEETRPTTPATLPRVKSRLSSRGYARRPSLSTFGSAQTLPRTNSSTSPDRFVPARRPGLSTTQSYRSNRDPQSLSKDERLLRNQDATPDAFNPRRRVTSPLPPTPPPNPRRVFSATRSGGGGISNFDY